MFRGWFELAVSLVVIWMMAYVVLPWGRTLPYIQPVMQVAVDSNVDMSAYWYSQCEITAAAFMHVRNTLRNR